MIKCTYQIGIWSVDFCGGRKTREPREKPSERDKTQQQTDSTCDVKSRNQTQASVVGGECSHLHAIPAPLGEGMVI